MNTPAPALRSGVLKRPSWISYAAAFLIQLMTTAILLWLYPYLPLGKFAAPYAAVLLFTVMIFGEGPAFLALVASSAGFYYHFVPPHDSWGLPRTGDAWAGLAAFVVINSTVLAAVMIIQRGRRRSESLARSIQEHARILDLAHVLIRDSDDRIVVWNTGLEALYGFTREEAIGTVSHELLNTSFPESREAVLQTLWQAGHWEGELVHTAKDGSKVVVASHQVLHRDGDDNSLAILEVNNDITGRIKAQRALEKALQDLAMANQDKDTMNEELLAGNEELRREIIQRAEIQAENAKLAAIVACSDDAIIGEDLDGIITSWNAGAERMYGYAAAEVVGESVRRLMPEDKQTDVDGILEKIRSGKPTEHYETERVRKDGQRIQVSLTVSPVRTSGGELVGASIIARDVSQQKRAEREREITVEFLQIINRSTGTDDLIRNAGAFFARESGCEAVGIRLREGEDFPYYEAQGFDEDFVAAENSLCSRDDCGCIVRDGKGYPICECMCGNVIQGRFDSSKPFFTEHGSFWTNSTTQLLATSTAEDRQARTRNRCNGEGYESVALIPLHEGDDRLGLLQLNDKRQGMFSPEAIGLWERFADYLAVALAKFQAEEALHENEAQKRRFYRQTILAATDGKLVVSERDEIAEIVEEPLREWSIGSISDVGTVRVEATEAARKAGMDESRIYDFMACVVESTGNVAKHAKRGRASLHQRNGSLVFVVTDNGPGISTMSIPDVALTRGYTTAGTLGMGYKVMINFADKVYLATGSDGTSVALELALHVGAQVPSSVAAPVN